MPIRSFQLVSEPRLLIRALPPKRVWHRGDDDPEASASVSMEDFKRLETPVTSSIESQNSQMDELREMITLLMPNKTASASPFP